VDAAEVQNTTFFHTPLVLFSGIADHKTLQSGSALACM